jgi:phage terminase large subunit
MFGGRGGAKSWGIARALLIRGVNEPGLRVLCTREVQSSMKESVHQLLKDQIKALRLGPVSEGGSGHYKVLDNEIRGPGGTLFMFKGLSDPEAIKSLEGCDVCWIEEARVVTKASWEKLDPTVRKDGSEIWISFNPELETDYLYQLFVKNEPPPGARVVRINWWDNPWFPEVLRTQMEHMRATDYDNYLHIWEGNCKVALEGAVYAKELRLATKQHRICRFAVDPSRPVHTFWDLGRGDLTAIWFVQIIGMEYRVVRYYQNNGEHISHFIHYLKEVQQDEGYTYGTMWLPHDADSELLASKRTIRQQIQDAEFKCRIVPKLGVAEGINAARTIFPNVWFHEVNAGDGIDALRHYHFDVRADGVTRSKKPVHDWSSNGADGFRYMGVALKEDKPKVKPKTAPRSSIAPGPRAWMGR